MISMDMLRDAQRVLDPVINRTPVVPTKGIVPGCDFYLKADCLQKTGAFKLRGAYYKIATLSDEEKARGVIACSAGNHAQGVAFAARDMWASRLPSASPRVRPSLRLRLPAATEPMWCWCPACMTTPTPRRCACGMSKG